MAGVVKRCGWGAKKVTPGAELREWARDTEAGMTYTVLSGRCVPALGWKGESNSSAAEKVAWVYNPAGNPNNE